MKKTLTLGLAGLSLISSGFCSRASEDSMFQNFIKNEAFGNINRPSVFLPLNPPPRLLSLGKNNSKKKNHTVSAVTLQKEMAETWNEIKNNQELLKELQNEMAETWNEIKNNQELLKELQSEMTKVAKTINFKEKRVSKKERASNIEDINTDTKVSPRLENVGDAESQNLFVDINGETHDSFIYPNIGSQNESYNTSDNKRFEYMHNSIIKEIPGEEDVDNKNENENDSNKVKYVTEQKYSDDESDNNNNTQEIQEQENGGFEREQNQEKNIDSDNNAQKDSDYENDNDNENDNNNYNKKKGDNIGSQTGNPLLDLSFEEYMNNEEEPNEDDEEEDKYNKIEGEDEVEIREMTGESRYQNEDKKLSETENNNDNNTENKHNRHKDHYNNIYKSNYQHRLNYFDNGDGEKANLLKKSL